MNEAWTKAEKQIARRAFDLAYDRECRAIAAEVRKRLNMAQEAKDIWALHDFLSKRRQQIDHDYDFRYSALTMVFGLLMRRKWLSEEDLHGLSDDKLMVIRNIASTP